MSLPFNTVSMTALDGGSNGPEGVYLAPGTKKVYVIDNQGGAGTHLVVVDFTSGTGVPSSIVTLTHAVGRGPVSEGNGSGVCVDGSGVLWSAYLSTGVEYVVGQSATTGSVVVGPYSISGLIASSRVRGMSAFSMAGTNYVACICYSGIGSTPWNIVILNAATGLLVWNYTLAAPGAISGGGTYNNFNSLSVMDFDCPSDGSTYIYTLARHVSSSGNVDDWVLYQLNVGTTTATVHIYHQGNSAIGGGVDLLVNQATGNLLVMASGGTILSVNSSGSITATSAVIMDTWLDNLNSGGSSNGYVIGNSNKSTTISAFQGGIVDTTNNQFLVPSPSSSGYSVRRVNATTLAAIDDSAFLTSWTGTSYTSYAQLYVAFVAGGAVMWPVNSGSIFDLLELLFTPSLGVSPSSLAYRNRVWAFSPHIGDGQGNDGTDQGQQVTLTASGAWTATSDVPWLFVSPSSGNGNSTVTVGLLKTEQFLPETGNGCHTSQNWTVHRNRDINSRGIGSTSRLHLPDWVRR